MRGELTTPCKEFASSIRRSTCPAPDFEIARVKDLASSIQHYIPVSNMEQYNMQEKSITENTYRFFTV